jgi:hypothetical protein
MKKLFKFTFKSISSRLFTKPILSFNKYNANKFYFCEKTQDDIINQFEKLIENNDNDIEKRIKLVSVKLMAMTKSNEALNYFEEKYIQTLVEDIQAEELILLLYFYSSLVEKECIESGNRKNVIDKRLDKYINMIEDKIDELDITNLLVLCWSASIMVNKFNYTFTTEFMNKLVKKLPVELPIDKKGDIPTLCFSISNLAEEKEPELLSIITDKISKYSKMFCIIFLI